MLLPIPGIGPTIRAMALERFTMSLAMAQEAGLPADQSARLVFRATANRAYTQYTDHVSRSLAGGEEWSAALSTTNSQLYTTELLEAIAIGEESGRLAEEMARLSQHFAEETSRRLQWSATILGGAIYVIVGLQLIFVIFRIAMSIGRVYDDAARGF
jgi:type II secretory pathway component PulF